MKIDLFQSCSHSWVFQICWHTEYSIFTASSFRIWNGSTGIPSPPLALFIAMLPKAHLISHSRMSESRWLITPLWLFGSWRSFLYSSSVYSCHLFLISSASVTNLCSVQSLSHFFSVTNLCQILCIPMDCSSPGCSVLHCLLQFAQIHIHWVRDGILPSHPLPASSPLAFNCSQHLGHFQWAGSSHQVGKVLEHQLQHQPFQWIFRTDFL